MHLQGFTLILVNNIPPFDFKKQYCINLQEFSILSSPKESTSTVKQMYSLHLENVLENVLSYTTA